MDGKGEGVSDVERIEREPYDDGSCTRRTEEGRKKQRLKDSNGEDTLLDCSDRVEMGVPLSSSANTGSREPPVFSAISAEGQYFYLMHPVREVTFQTSEGV